MNSNWDINNLKLFSRLKVLNCLKSLPDQLLNYLIEYSDPLPIFVPQGVILFRQNDFIQCWYLLLSGEVQLYIEQSTSKNENKLIEQQITIIRPGILFGSLQSAQHHSCSAKILKNAEFVKIPQNNFLSIYNKWGDRLHSCILPIEDLIIDNQKRQRQLPKLPNEKKKKIKKEENKKYNENINLIENNNTNNKEEEEEEEKNIIEKGFLLEIKNILKYDNNEQLFYSIEILANEMSASNFQKLTGLEFCDKLFNIWIDCFGIKPSNSLILLGIGQLLFDKGFLIISTNNDHNNQQFCEFKTYYWSSSSLLLNSNNKLNELIKYLNNKKDLLINSLLYLANIGLDILLQFILQKPKELRTEKELKLIEEEINYFKGFNYFNKEIKKRIAKILYWEGIEFAGTIIFKKGDEAINWYFILNGCLEAKSLKGKKTILREGDDFGKLSILNNFINKQKRQLTVITLQNNCQLLKLNSFDFQQIISEIENETIRLKQQNNNNNDVLILLKDTENCSHLLVSGLPENIIEYILETRTELNFIDNLFEEVILTLPFWITINKLCNLLKYYYLNGTFIKEDINNNNNIIINKYRTIYFLINWQNLIEDKLFFDPIINSFIEELFSYLLEDYNKQKLIFNNIFEQMNKLMIIRENALLRFARPPKIVLNCGEYINNNNLNNYFDPLISSDICNQLILLSNKQIIQQIQLGQTCSEIIKQIKLEQENNKEKDEIKINFEKKLFLYELCSDGRKILINENECSIPLIIEYGSILFLTNEIEQKNKIKLLKELNNNKIIINSSSLILNFNPERLANAISLFHFKLFFATSEHELLVQIIGRDKFHTNLAPFNLDLLLNRFNQLQLWVITEIIFASNLIQRLSIINSFIQLIQKLKENNDLFSMAAINFGLISLPTSRLNYIWNKLPKYIYYQYIQLQSFLCPKRGYKNYRILINNLKPPFVPFIPLILKELNFLYESLSNQNLINWEKMHITSKILCSFKLAKGNKNLFELFDKQTFEDEKLIYNLNIVNKPSLLMKLSNELIKNEEKEFY